MQVTALLRLSPSNSSYWSKGIIFSGFVSTQCQRFTGVSFFLLVLYYVFLGALAVLYIDKQTLMDSNKNSLQEDDVDSNVPTKMLPITKDLARNDGDDSNDSEATIQYTYNQDDYSSMDHVTVLRLTQWDLALPIK